MNEKMSGVLTLNIPGARLHYLLLQQRRSSLPPLTEPADVQAHTATSFPTLRKNQPPQHTLHPHPTGVVSQGCRCHRCHPDSETDNCSAALGGRGGVCWVDPCFIDGATVMNQLLWSWCLPADRHWPLQNYKESWHPRTTSGKAVEQASVGVDQGLHLQKGEPYPCTGRPAAPSWRHSKGRDMVSRQG